MLELMITHSRGYIYGHSHDPQSQTLPRLQHQFAPVIAATTTTMTPKLSSPEQYAAVLSFTAVRRPFACYIIIRAFRPDSYSPKSKLYYVNLIVIIRLWSLRRMCWSHLHVFHESTRQKYSVILYHDKIINSRSKIIFRDSSFSLHLLIRNIFSQTFAGYALMITHGSDSGGGNLSELHHSTIRSTQDL